MIAIHNDFNLAMGCVPLFHYAHQSLLLLMLVYGDEIDDIEH